MDSNENACPISPDNLAAQLQLSRGVGGRSHASEVGRVRHVVARYTVDHGVQQVESLRTEFEAEPLPNGEGAEDRGVQVPKGSDRNRLRPPFPKVYCAGIWTASVFMYLAQLRFETLLTSPTMLARSYCVHPTLPVLGHVTAHINVVNLARASLEDGIDLPVTEHVVEHAVFGAERLALSDRHTHRPC